MGCILSTNILPNKKIFPQSKINHLKNKLCLKRRIFKSKKSISINEQGDNTDNGCPKNDRNSENNSGKKTENLSNNSTLDSNDNVNRTDKEQNCYFLQLPESNVVDDTKEVEYIMRTEPISMFKKLEPIKNPPKLTVDILEKKLLKAEQKRRQVMQKRKKSGKLKTTDADTKRENIKEKFNTADKNREAWLQKIRDKQLLQQERVKRAKDRVERMREIDQELLNELEIMNDAENEESSNSWPTREGSNSQGRLTISNHSTRENIPSNHSDKAMSFADCHEFDKESLELERIIGPGISRESSSSTLKKEFSNSPTTIDNIYQFPQSKRCSPSGGIIDSFFDN